MGTTIDTSKFDRAMREYLKYTKKDLKDVVNTKAYYVARNAVALTKTTDKTVVESSLRQASMIAPGAPVAAIIVQKQRAAAGKEGLYGRKMETAVNKLIRIRKNTVNFLRAGWIPAIKEFEGVGVRGGPQYKKPIVKGTPKGGGRACRSEVWKAEASIWNSVTGGTNTKGLNKSPGTDKIHSILQEGLQKAINKEEASMRQYVEKKIQATANKINRG